ncbi:MAG: hypothetical protein N3D79_04350 [Acidilobaceae archaeon]|nr:hypothetical protein [Acidilobaceae archaeon]
MDSSERALRVAESLGGGTLSLLGPLLLSGSALLALASTLLGSPSPVFLTALVSLAFLGGTLELYHLLLLVHAEAVVKRGPPAIASLLYALLSLSLYYFLIGIALISWRHDRLAAELGCERGHGLLVDVLTLGLSLSRKQQHLAVCIKERLSSMKGE